MRIGRIKPDTRTFDAKKKAWVLAAHHPEYRAVVNPGTAAEEPAKSAWKLIAAAVAVLIIAASWSANLYVKRERERKEAAVQTARAAADVLRRSADDAERQISEATQRPAPGPAQASGASASGPTAEFIALMEDTNRRATEGRARILGQMNALDIENWLAPTTLVTANLRDGAERNVATYVKLMETQESDALALQTQYRDRAIPLLAKISGDSPEALGERFDAALRQRSNVAELTANARNIQTTINLLYAFMRTHKVELSGDQVILSTEPELQQFTYLVDRAKQFMLREGEIIDKGVQSQREASAKMREMAERLEAGPK